jgi:nucleotide-binding universal stress UspA family protein
VSLARKKNREEAMAIKIIVSYDGTEMDQDALALGRLLAGAGAELALAYVRHSREEEGGREQLAAEEAAALLDAGAAWLDNPDVPRFIVFSASTPEGLSELAKSDGASLIVFGSEYRTTPGDVEPQTSARRLLDGGRIAIAVAPAGLHRQTDRPVKTIGAITPEDDPGCQATAESLAARLGAEMATNPHIQPDFLVIGSKIGTTPGKISMSAAGQYLMGTVRCPVLVLPRGGSVVF